MGGAGVSAQNARTGLKNNRWGEIEYTSMVGIRTGPLHRRARMDVARCLVARARPTVPEAQLGQSGTFTRGGPGCSQAPSVLAPGPRLRRKRSPSLPGPAGRLAPAIRGARPAAPAVAWSESPGPGPRARDLRMVLATGLSVPHLRPDCHGTRHGLEDGLTPR